MAITRSFAAAGLIALACWPVTVAAAREDPPATSERDRLRAAVERSLPLMQASMQTWIERSDCLSCHHQGLGTLAVVFTRERGFAVNEELQARQLEWMARKTSLSDLLQGDGGINGSFSRGYELLALDAAGYPRGELTDALAHYLAGNASHAGPWLSESHRPPLEDSPVTSTALAVRVLSQWGNEARRAEIDAKIARARAWLEQVEPASNEEHTMRLLGLYWAGATAATVTGAAQALAAEQRPDGGWAQIETRASDAYATGQALVALQQVGGLSSESDTWRRGVRFLLATQEEDGSWLVETRRRMPGLPYFETGFPHKLHQFLSFAATAWSTMALAAALDPRPSIVFHGPPAAGAEAAASAADEPSASETTGTTAAESALAPVHRAVLYGTEEELGAALDEGAEVDTRGPGGVTPLMLAVHERAKVELLLERGADPNARSDVGCTALALAAWYGGAEEALELLLARGADPRASAADGLTPFLRAARSGDERRVRLLLANGAELEEAYFGITALLFACFQGNVELARFLIDRGASLAPRFMDKTSLMLACINGHHALAELLVASGAELDAVDEEGMTALAWAAKVDYGSPRTVELLLAAGADRTLASADGRTPLDWALHFGNERNAEALRR